jgi:dTDP-4-dehydrorhamnose 3,5-epimerase
MTHGRVAATEIAGLVHAPAFRADDDRGRFVKVHSAGDERFWPADWDEIYYSTSRRGVVRGMHLQLPPHDHHKAVHCLVGGALDVIVDLRAESPTFGKHTTIELDGDRPELVVVPPGCGHGFQALTDDTVMLYLVSSVHEPTADTGVRWDSFGCRWPIATPTVSERDRGLPTFEVFSATPHRAWRA